MRRLAPFVNVIPIIAKADTMTTRELAEFKATIRTELSNRGVLTFSPRITPELILELEVGGCSSRHQLAMSADAAEGGAGHKHDNQMRNIVPQPPYAVIGSTEVVRIPSLINDQRDSRVLGRQYPWGVCEVENASHCDMQALRSLLVRTHMGALVESTNDIYSHYRRTTMLEAAATVRRGRTAFALLAICGVVVVVLVISMLQSPVIGSAVLSMWILAAFVWLVAFQMSESVRRISQPYLSAGLFRFLSSTTCCRTQQTQATARDIV
jgi:septin family protein